MTDQPIDRRRLLARALAASGLAGALVAGFGVRRARRRAARRSALNGLSAEAHAAAVRIGELALADLHAPDEAALWDRLERSLLPWPAAGLDDAALRARLRATIEAEFDRDATLPLHGFRFAETEVALVTLVALEARRAAEGGTG